MGPPNPIIQTNLIHVLLESGKGWPSPKWFSFSDGIMISTLQTRESNLFKKVVKFFIFDNLI